MSSPLWYWHRLRAMSPAEFAAHGRRKIHQLTGAALGAKRFSGVSQVPDGSTFPQLPSPDQAPQPLKAALRQDAADILAGRWLAFGYLPLQVEDPPRWHKDYLAGVDLATHRPALRLHHRLEGSADIKLIWEPSRWYSLVRLAQAAYLLRDATAADACLRWLEDWGQANPPFLGWNWTSALETGLRLIQFAWIEALLAGVPDLKSEISNLKSEIPNLKSQTSIPESGIWNLKSGISNPRSQISDPKSEISNLKSEIAPPPTALRPPPTALDPDCAARLRALRRALLPPHLWFTWRDRSFGSSANNHLIGELSGLIVATVRWPALAKWAAPLDRLQPLWEREVLTQYAPDGGNREQALNYHLFSWEFCWQARLALRAAGRTIAPEVEDRLRAAAGFFCAIQSESNPWDYGDSDSAFVTPFFEQWTHATSEWHEWLREPARSPAIRFWIGDAPKASAPAQVVSGAKGWRVYPKSGLAVCRLGDWFLRWDLSPLGYLSTAGHGHCDALHLSLWHKGQPILIDPGTGAYHADRRLRDYLSSWDAHNGPHPANAAVPERRGAFLWVNHHPQPRWEKFSDLSMRAELNLPTGVMRRTITRWETEDGWQIDDGFYPAAGSSPQETAVLWQLAPTAHLRPSGQTEFEIEVGPAKVAMRVGSEWKTVQHGSPKVPSTAQLPAPGGVCSPAFRRVEPAPFILLKGTTQADAVLRTTFLAGS